MSDPTHAERAEAAINAANENLRQSQTEVAQVVATVATAEALLAVKDEIARARRAMT